MLGWITTWVGTAVAVGATVAAEAPVPPWVALVWVVLAAGVAAPAAAVVERLSSQDWTVAVAFTWATSNADPFAALMAAQPPSVAANEADVSKILTLLIAAARRLPVRVTFISGTILSRSLSTWHTIAATCLDDAYSG